MGVEDGANLDAAEEGEENIHAKDPANGAFTVVFELVFGEICLNYDHGVSFGLVL